MNIVGKIGKYIIENQDMIEIILLIVVVVIVIAFIIKLIVSANKKRNILFQINKTVSEINNTVSDINSKRTVSTYTDGITRNTSEKDVFKPERPKDEIADPDMKKDIAGYESNSQYPEVPKKYFSRDCSVDKNGKSYTFEELDSQIKE